ncbi:MAG: hypothetical protein R2716_06570 [Microthrixaceae bacterium]
MSATTDRVGSLVAPVLERLGLTLYDVDRQGSTLRILVDGPGGVDLDSPHRGDPPCLRRPGRGRAGGRLLHPRGVQPGAGTAPALGGALPRSRGKRVKVKLFPGAEGDTAASKGCSSAPMATR